MASLEAATNDKKYLSIVDGSIREKVAEGTPNAIRREWEAGGEKGVKFELIYKQITGRIVGVEFYDGESGGRKFRNLNLRFEEIDGKTPILSVGLSTRYATDLLKKLPNIDLKEEVLLRPYSFTPDGEEKEKVGVEIKQRDYTGNFEKKITNFFHKKEGEKWVEANGYPAPTDEDREDWKFYYLKAGKFLEGYTKQHIIPQFEGEVAATEYPAEEIDPESIPF